MYDVFDSCAPDSDYSSVVSLGASVSEVPVASVGTCVDTSLGAAPEDTSLSFTLDSGASHCFFRDHTTLASFPAPVSVALADPTLGPVTARYTTTLPCPAVPSGFLTGFHVPSFSRNLVGVRSLVRCHVGVWIEPSGKTAVCVDGDTYAPLAIFTVELGFTVSGQVPVSGPVAASCSCRSLAHPTVLWHHRLGHPSIPRLRAMSSQRLVLGLLRVLTSLPPSLAPPCGPSVEGRLRTTPHSSSLRPVTEPFETLHLDVTSTLIRWLLTTADTRGRCVSCLHSDRRGLVMEIARTSLTHARAPHFLWPCAVRYAAHQLNLWPCVSRPEVSPTSFWTGSPGVALRFRVWGCLAFVHDTSADKISPRTIPCVFLGFPKESSNFTFYHPPLHRFFHSHDVRFDESVPYYVRYPCRGLPVRSPSLQSSSQPTADPAGAGVRGEDPGGASSSGVGVGVESVPVRGPGSGGAGVEAEPVRAGGSSPQGAGVSRAVPGGATTEGAGAPAMGPGESGTGRVAVAGADSGGGASGALEGSPGATTAPDTTPPPHPYQTRHQARQQAQQQPPQQEQQQQPQRQPPQQEQQEQQQQPSPLPPISGLRTLGLPSPSPPPSPSPSVYSPTFPPPDYALVVFPHSQPPLSPPLSHAWTSRSPRACPSSPVPLTDLRTVLFRPSLPRSSPSVFPSPSESALTASLSNPVTDYYRAFRPVLSCVLTTRSVLFSLVFSHLLLPSPVLLCPLSPLLLPQSLSLPLLAALTTPLYRCPSGCDGHYHHSWGSACVDLHVHADGASPGYVAASCSCRLLSRHFFGTTAWVTPPCHAFVACTPVSLSLVSPGLCLPCRPRLPPPVFLASRDGTRVSGQGRERYFLLVVDDYTRYTTVFSLRSKGDVSAVLIPWIRTVRLQLRERFGQDLPVLRLHSVRGGEFSSDLLRDFCRGDGITQSFTLPNSPQQNGIAERRIGLVMEVARTSMIHAAASHILWPFAVRYAVHQLNLWPRVSLPETSPTLRWTGKVGDVSVFRVWGSCAFVRDTSADKLSARAIPCVFLGFVPDAPGWQFYHPTSRRVLPSHGVTFDESVPFYRLFPYRSAPSPPPPLFLAPGPPLVDPLPPQGPAPSGVSQVDPLLGTAPVQVAIVSGAARGAASGGAIGGSEGAEPEGAESEGAESGGAEPRGTALSGGRAGASPRMSSQQLREWLVLRAHCQSGAPGAGKFGGAGAGGAAVTTGVGDPTEPVAAGAGGAGAGVAGVGGPGAGGAGGAGAGSVDSGAGGAGGTVRPRLYFVPLLQQVLGVPSSTVLPPPFLCLTERREPASCPVLPVHTAHRAPRSRTPPVPGTHTMALRPSSVPLRVPLPAPPESSLPAVPNPESDRARAASPTVARLLATALTDPSFESAAASALVGELLDFVAACRLDYASALVAKSVPASPPSVGGECALGTDVLEDRQEDFECLAADVPRFASLLLAPEGDPDAPDIPTPRSYAEAITGTYVDEVPPPGVNIVDGMWIFRVKRPPGSQHAFKARYVARGFSQQQGHDYELHSLDFSTAFLQGSLHEEIWLRRQPGFTGSFPTADPSLPPFYVLVYVDDLLYATADTEALTLVNTSSMGLVLGGRGLVVLTGHADASWVDNSATQRSSQGYTFSLGSGSVSWRSTCSSSVLSSSCEAEIYAGSMAAQELRWLTYLLTDLGEQPCSPPVLNVDNKAMLALCQEHRLEHRTMGPVSRPCSPCSAPMYFFAPAPCSLC
ncbi:unnamed protein product [Closterium sp. NIES-53]